MPFLFLSPSTQDFNPYVTSGNEQYWMNALADLMTPILHASGVNVTRNDPTANAATSIRLSNEGRYDFHLALHSNASPPAKSGQSRGIELYYYPTSDAGLRMAGLLADSLAKIYPLPDRIQLIATTQLGEVRRTNAPSVLVELGYHDNPEDADWLTGNLEAVAEALCEGVCAYFGIPLLPVTQPASAQILQNTPLYSLPDTAGEQLAQLSQGERIELLGELEGWYTAQSGGVYGFVRADRVQIT